MKCPFCNHTDTKVIDSRVKNEGRIIRRRRECLNCSKRFTTREQIEQPLLLVIKSDGSREPFNRDKLFAGIQIACTKRPVSIDSLENLVTTIENEIRDSGRDEVDAHLIGELVMRHLKTLDEIAYVRFASVYRKFSDKEEFMNELRELKSAG
ncbi:transcriptional repressor NrdR [candidate division KSB1 bacterium]|nr:transcriptional repressor NrdR [candidate division KSB1 bacterium]